jgi:two-component system, OmpR family, phosphate regulon sensor histidine kinase PhoR
MNNPLQNHIIVVTSDPQAGILFERVLKSVGYKAIVHADFASARVDLDLIVPILVILDEKLRDGEGLDFAGYLLRRSPALPVVLYLQQESTTMLGAALRMGVSDYICAPLDPGSILKAVQHSLQQSQQRREWTLLETRRHTASLNRRVSELETLARLGRSVTSSLNLDSVLSAVVDAAVQLTGAEEGSLLLLDESSGELYVRAARNFNEEFVRTFRLPIQDTLAGSVLRSGQPVLVDENTPQKIKTSYLVHSLLYVPIQINGHVFGVLGVDNRTKRLSFKDYHIQLLSTMADYAVIAIENARLFTSVNTERSKLETILTCIQDGVIVVDTNQRLVLVNTSARQAFNLDEVPLDGKPFNEVFVQSDLQELIDTSGKSLSNRVEFVLPDGRVFVALLTPIPEVGTVIILHDITYLKKLDRIKNDFVSTVSHDLRSPLTAVLGYVELIERAGPVNDLQREFVRRVQGSVHNITNLVDDLVNLGRIEAGFDTRKENLQIERILRYATDGFKKQLAEKCHTLVLELPPALPDILGNPVQLRQAIDHLMDNAIRYTHPGGTLTIYAEVEEKQVIVQFRDTGIGIPTQDLPYIFDKFYRASNASMEASGTGLGLAIVRSVIDSHQGRIWVDSRPGEGTTFTIVIPIAEEAPHL